MGWGRQGEVGYKGKRKGLLAAAAAAAAAAFADDDGVVMAVTAGRQEDETPTETVWNGWVWGGGE